MGKYYKERLAIDRDIKKQYFVQCLTNPQLYETDLLPTVCFLEYAQEGGTYYAVIDRDCVNKVMGSTWGYKGNGYVGTDTCYLHRVILNETRSDYHVHHKAAK